MFSADSQPRRSDNTEVSCSHHTHTPERLPSLRPCDYCWSTQQQEEDCKMIAKSSPKYIYMDFITPARKCMNNVGEKIKAVN